MPIPVPRVSITYPDPPPPPKFNESKVALLIENRPIHFLAPLMLHFISVVPPDWKFRFMGSRESVEFIKQSYAIRQQVAIGKLDLTYIPSNMTTAGGEAISRFLTNLWVYETLLQPAEWLLVFQTDSMLCANSRQSLNDYLDYDWVGAPWNPWGAFGGNGGLSMRRVSSIVQVLRDQVRRPDSEPEDVWLTERLGHRPGAKMANGTTSLEFSGEMNPGSTEKLWRPEDAELDGMKVTSANLDLDEAGQGYMGSEDDEDAELPGPGRDPKNTVLDMAASGAWVEGIDDWRNGFYEPMGYHIGSSGANLHGGIWGTASLRKHIWDYCPEVKIMLNMDAAQYVPGECNTNWKRGNEPLGDMGALGEISLNDLGFGTEMIDGLEYPRLPPGFGAW